MPGAIYFDLRTDVEVEYHGRLDLPVDWSYQHRPVFDSDLGHPVEASRFEEALERYHPIILEIATQVVTSPVVVSCSLGKDRTGFVVAALLYLLEVARGEILSDYALSNERLALFRFDRPYSSVQVNTGATWLDFLSDRLRTPPETVSALRGILLPAADGQYTSKQAP